MTQSPLDLAGLPTPVDDSDELRRHLEGLTIRGKDAEALVGDIKGARTLLMLFNKFGSKYEGCEAFQKELMPLVQRKIENALTDKDAAVWAKVGLVAMHQNGVNVDRMITLAGLSKASEAAVSVQINNTTVDKVLTIVDPIRGSHGRTQEDQEALNDAARKLLFGESRLVSVEETRVGPSPGAQVSAGGRPLLDAQAPENSQRDSCPNAGEAKPSVDTKHAPEGG